MALVGNDFNLEHVTKTCRCSECGRKLGHGDTALVSIRYGRVQKRICSEACRIAFDDRFWQERAFERRYNDKSTSQPNDTD